ncbi:Na+/H+ antiporter NhaC family protein [Candidatus Laterigemmans baculatus]|uniref:Na+/H+ antiporter NhaC family protein n=1 Tax=Candidatus Laterigemmans baculatus TaxID=2770505 RepID=UPI001F468D7F|nr:Na+/H+ antiporter NhaC family protein [Candidatus Laterigemmans baculatus]
MDDYGWLSLLPPLIAIVLAILTRRVVLSLGLAILAGAMLLSAGAPGGWSLAGTLDSAWNDHLFPALRDESHLQVLYFSLLLGGMVGVLAASGGMEALVRSLSRRASHRRGGQGLVGALGLVIFFDDYANTLLLGTTMQSTADRLRFSRAKLAYLVDSTAAPVAGLALVSTWVATEISLIGEGLVAAGVAADVTPFGVFVSSVAYRFYAILALVLVALVAWSGRDFGPMWRAEQDAWTAAEAVPGGAADGSSDKSADRSAEVVRPADRWLWLAAVLPVVACVVTVGVVLVQTGSPHAAADRFGVLRYWGEVIGSADSYAALVWGGGVGLGVALLSGVVARRASLAELLGGAARGAAHLLPAMWILWLAWSLSSMTEGVTIEDGKVVAGPFLDTGGFLAEVLRSSGMPGWMLPTAIFVTAGFVALSTGTSWGTMAILTPLSVQLAVAAGGAVVGEAEVLSDGGPWLIAVVGAVLAGSIFGDHCSPISDTTVLSSRASGCDHILHVRTQLPYALLAAGVAILCGTLPSGLGAPVWACLLAGAAMLVAAMRWFGNPVEG